MRLRPYQVAAQEAICREFQTVSSTLLVLPTGTGKTVTFASLASSLTRDRVLILAHRDELIRQAADTIQDVCHELVGIEKGQERAGTKRIVVSSVQTMCRPNRHQPFDPEQFGLVIVDEAHHAIADTYRRTIHYFRNNKQLKVLGVTATPKRADKLAMGNIFDSVAFQYEIVDAVTDGWLVPVQQQVVQVNGLDYSAVHEVAKDFNEGELEAVLTKESILHCMARPIAEVAGSKQTLVFCVSVKHAHAMAAVLSRYTRCRMAALDGNTDESVRQRTVQAYRDGDVQILLNCGLFLEGFDAPTTSLVAMCRPTKSLALYTQVLGRGTRPLKGIVDGIDTPEGRREAIQNSSKPSMLLLDFAGNAGRHKIIRAQDVLGGQYAGPIREYAAKNDEVDGNPMDVNASLDRAEAELELIEEEERRQKRIVEEAERRRRRIVAEVDYQTVDVSPFARGARMLHENEPAPPTREREPASDKQVRYLVRLGMEEDKARALGKKQAGFWIGKLVAEKQGAA